uniref:Pancreatic progenitor cell differentiation and proliferation factor n=1 Tax=Equus asinus TaxID=9793 RepID=A0A9L0J964_EQUAS
VGASAHAQPARPGRGSASRVFSANGLRGLASPSPPPVIARRGARGVAAEVRAGAARGGAERARVGRRGRPSARRAAGRTERRPEGRAGTRAGVAGDRAAARRGAGRGGWSGWAGVGRFREPPAGSPAHKAPLFLPRGRFGPVGAAPPRAAKADRALRSPAPARLPPAHKQEHGSHPLQRLARGHPRLLPANSSCGSAEYPGEAIPHHPGLPKADPGHWWASFFFGKSTLPFMATVLESPEHSESPQASSSTITCDLAPEASRKQPGGQPAKTNAGPPS